MTKFIFVTGGVLSSLGKGLASAAIGALLESRGLTVTFQKLDPYINVDPGTMNPFQHGEVFVADDGTESDLDLGHYERFTSITVGAVNNFTSGQIYDSVITKDEAGKIVEFKLPRERARPYSVAVDKSGNVWYADISGFIGMLPASEATRVLRRL